MPLLNLFLMLLLILLLQKNYYHLNYFYYCQFSIHFIQNCYPNLLVIINNHLVDY